MKLLLKALAAVALLFAGCGRIVDMGPNHDAGSRRVYVNDAAANDSLPGALRTQGLQLVLQPGAKPYVLRMKTAAAGDVLDFYVPTATGTFTRQQVIAGVAAGDGFRAFPLQAPAGKAIADDYLVFLRGAHGGRAALPDSVRLVSVDTTGSQTVAVRLLMVRRLRGLPTDSAKAAYARAFHTELRSIYAAYGITVDTSTVIVEPSGDSLTVNFDVSGDPIPGTRLAKAINMYLVNDIRSEAAGGTVLGFAPREAIDMSSDEESRVVLNVRGGTGAMVAVTAAHEMGHFLGLRHTSATSADVKQDGDKSNRNDGFASTPFCPSLDSLSIAKLAKSPATEGSPAREITLRTPGGRAYCLRVAGVAATCNCPDVGNLMYPYGCNLSTQKVLGADQQGFLRRNLGLYQ